MSNAHFNLPSPNLSLRTSIVSCYLALEVVGPRHLRHGPYRTSQDRDHVVSFPIRKDLHSRAQHTYHDYDHLTLRA